MQFSTADRTHAASGRFLFLGVAVVVFALDRITKGLVNATVAIGQEYAAIDHFLYITHVQNSGAAFGLAPVASSVFIGISLIVAAALLVYEFRMRGLGFVDVLLGLILGGTAGNGFDRLIANGSVTDFISLHFWPVFNVADSAISIGVVLLLLRYLLRKGSDA